MCDNRERRRKRKEWEPRLDKERESRKLRKSCRKSREFHFEGIRDKRRGLGVNYVRLEEGSRDFSEVLRTSSVRTLLTSSTLLTSNRLLLTVTLLSTLLTVVQLRVTSSNGRRRSSSRCGTLLGRSSGRESLLLLLSTVSVVRLLESRVVGRNLLERLSVVSKSFLASFCQFKGNRFEIGESVKAYP